MLIDFFIFFLQQLKIFEAAAKYLRELRFVPKRLRIRYFFSDFVLEWQWSFCAMPNKIALIPAIYLQTLYILCCFL